MKKKYIVILLVFLALSACGRKPAVLGVDAPAENVPDIVATYALNAIDPTGEQYGGTLVIMKGDKPNEYKMQWLVSGGLHEGTGILEGNQLTAIWHSYLETDDPISGTASYTVTVNGELYGTRSIDGIETPGQETAYPNKK